MSKLDALKNSSTIVADTGEIEQIKVYKPTDATTNPSLILAASEMEEYASFIDDAIAYGKRCEGGEEQRLEGVITKLFVNFGVEILKYVPGRVSTEVDAKLSFDTEASIKKAREYIALYEKAGIPKERILVKLASTWEGIEAARILEAEGIHCNMTLMFSLAQAVAAADAGATLISPFVGRILDWYKKSEGKESYPPDEDPGVLSVTEIYNYYKKFDYPTQVMGASFRNTEEILELAGCDLLTINPKLLKKLQAEEGSVHKKLDEGQAKQKEIDRMTVDEKRFRWLLNEDAMATEKLAEGIRTFSKDTRKLEAKMRKRLSS